MSGVIMIRRKFGIGKLKAMPGLPRYSQPSQGSMMYLVKSEFVRAIYFKI